MEYALPVPEAPDLKDVKNFRLVGTSVADVDLEPITSGRQQYSLDLKLPDMLYAVVRRCPHGDGQPASFDASEASKIPGVVDFHMLRNSDHGGRIILPNCPNFVSGVAVLATSTWAAMQGAEKLSVEWQMPDARDDSDGLMQRCKQALDSEAEIVRRDGDADFGDQQHGIDVTYSLPFLAHVPMEPMNCTAHVIGDRAEVWAPTQNPPMAAEAVAKVLDIPQKNVTINVMPGARYWEIWDKTAFGMTGWTHRPLGVMVLNLGYRSGVPWNESRYANPEFDKALDEAGGTPVDNAEAADDGVQPTLERDVRFTDAGWAAGFDMQGGRTGRDGSVGLFGSTASLPRRRPTNSATLSPSPSPRRTKGSARSRSFPFPVSKGEVAKAKGCKEIKYYLIL